MLSSKSLSKKKWPLVLALIIMVVFSTTATTTTTQEAKTLSVACVGDSITFGSHSSDPDRYSYPAQLQVLLDILMPGQYDVSNLGVSGATAQRAGDEPYWETDAFEELTSRSWDVAVVMLGTNDAKPQNWRGMRAFLDDYDALLSSFAATYTYVMIPPPLMLDEAYDMNATVINDEYPKTFFDAFLTDNDDDDDSLNVDGVVDVFAALGGVPDWRQVFPPDGCALTSAWGPCAYYCSVQDCDQCHPNDVGYQRLAATVVDAVLQIDATQGKDLPPPPPPLEKSTPASTTVFDDTITDPLCSYSSYAFWLLLLLAFLLVGTCIAVLTGALSRLRPRSFLLPRVATSPFSENKAAPV